MKHDELTALRQVADREVLFHAGTWGGPAGYRWRGSDGAEAGLVPQPQTETLDRLTKLGMITPERRLGPLDRELTVTPTGTEALEQRVA
jgi:hypothetical protein